MASAQSLFSPPASPHMMDEEGSREAIRSFYGERLRAVLFLILTSAVKAESNAVTQEPGVHYS